MTTFTVKKAYEQFQEGDELQLNARQAKYLLISGHIVPVDAVIAAKTKELSEKQDVAYVQSGQELELEPRSEDETDAVAAGKKKDKKGE
jgi:hypothetical protein